MRATYTYYTETYCGTMPEDDFNRHIRRAEAYIDAVTFGRANDSLPRNVANKVYDAECAIADIFHKEGNGVIASASNDGYSETYAVGNATVEQHVQETALLYLGLTGLMFCGGIP